MYHIFFIHSSVYRHWSCFYVLAIINSAKVNIGGACIFSNYGFLCICIQEWVYRIMLFCSVAKLYPTLCDPMDWNTSDFPVLHYLLEFAQTHVHWVDDAIQPSHSLSSPSPPDLSLSQHHGLFQWVGSLLSDSQSIGASASASVLPMNIEGWFPLGLTGMISLQSKGLSRVFSNTIVQKYPFFGTQPSLCFNSYIRTWLLEKIIALTVQIFC